MVKVAVIGDSHGRGFWSGHNHLDGRDNVPGFSTFFIGGWTAWSLTIESSESRKKWLDNFNKLMDEKFDGWIMITHGEVDARFRLRDISTEKGIDTAVQLCVDKYFGFIEERFKQYRQISVWACPATAVNGTHYAEPGVEQEIERNIISYLFNKKLAKLLLPHKIPMFGVLPYMINADGTTKAEMTYDTLHASQSLRPLMQPVVEKYLPIYESVKENSVELQRSCYNHELADSIFMPLIESRSKKV